MILSRENNYLFVEIPNTACTAISAELQENYGGGTILKKHAKLPHAERLLGEELLNGLFKFCGVRNPLDVWVTRFMKLKTDHKQNFTTPARFVRNGGWVTDRKLEEFAFIRDNEADFSAYVERFPDSLDLDRRTVDVCQHVIRYENLQEDFAAAIAKIGLDLARPLPHINPTKDKADFRSYYNAEAQSVARERLGATMSKLGYEFPENFA